MSILRLVVVMACLAGSSVVRAQSEPWEAMDYGPFLSAAIEVTPDNIACKGIAIPLDEDGSIAMLFDTDTLRWACGWRGDFVALRGIVYDGPHGIWPTIDGDEDWTTPREPGVSVDGSFTDPRASGFGNLPSQLGRWFGLALTEDGPPVLAYSIGTNTQIREQPIGRHLESGALYGRRIEYVSRDAEAFLRLARIEHDAVERPEIVGYSSVMLLRGGRAHTLICVQSRQEGTASLEVVESDVLLKLGAAEAPHQTLVFIARIEEPADLGEAAAIVQEYQAESVNASPPATPLWAEKPVLAGTLEVQFGSDTGTQRIVHDPDSDVDAAPVAIEEGWSGSLLNLRGEAIDGHRAPVDEAILLLTSRVDEGRERRPIAAWNCDEGDGLALANMAGDDTTLALEGATWRRGVSGRSLDFDGTAYAQWDTDDAPEFLETDLTVAAWIHTTKDGVIFSQTRPRGKWVPNGKTLFVRNGRLCYDVGWVGVISGPRTISDGAWHHVAMTWDHDSGEVVLYVDGSIEAEGALAPKDQVVDDVLRFGFCAEDFPGQPWFSGYMDGLRIFDRVLNAGEVRAVADESGEPLVEARAVRGMLDAEWVIDDEGAVIEFDRSAPRQSASLVAWQGPLSRLGEFTSGFDAAGGRAAPPFMIDRVSWPAENTYDSWMRFGDFDFLDDGRAAAISTWNGDVWRVDGLDDELERLTWQRIATGLSQPLGLKTRGQEILVVGRDQITRLIDLNGDREADVYANFNDDTMNTEHFHEPCSGLQSDQGGNLYYAKAARHAKVARHPQHGTVMRVSADGQSSEIVASGQRAPNGIWVDPDGVIWTSDQEGHWMPANRINRVVPGGFYGNNWSGTGTPRDSHDAPLCWIHPTVDRSPSAQLRVPDGMWGDLSGALLGMSYGTGEVYRILEDEVNGMHQGGIVPLPIQIPTGAMRGRFNPRDGHLYLCGLFGWSSDQTEPGGFYRVRRSETTYPMPMHVRAVGDGLVIKFNAPVAVDALDPDQFDIEAWNYRWSQNYGSPRLELETGEEGVTELEVEEVTASDDGRTVHVRIADMQPAMQMHVEYTMPFENGVEVDSYIHLTVHALAE